jgi:hypothetical protein
MNLLHLQIQREDSITQVMEKFTILFPALQIKIFKHLNNEVVVQGQDIMICPDAKMYQINPYLQDHLIPIHERMTVSQFEEIFKKKSGVSIQVFRKNGSVVEESSLLIDFLLEDENHKSGRGLAANGKTVLSHISFRQ